jgi:hypothetical protein
MSERARVVPLIVEVELERNRAGFRRTFGAW